LGGRNLGDGVAEVLRAEPGMTKRRFGMGPRRREERAEGRVAESTSERVNRRIERDIEAHVMYYSQRLDEIEERLTELDREWDIERTLETNAAALSLLGLILGSVSRKWRALPMVVAGFLLQHGIQGWCPPLPLFRRLGIRTRDEILRERTALRALRGDFDRMAPSKGKEPCDRAQDVLEAISGSGRDG